MQYIVLVGNVYVGFHAAGPFNSYAQSEAFIAQCLDSPDLGMILEIIPPGDHSIKLRTAEEPVSVQLDRLLDCYLRETGAEPGIIVIPQTIFARLLDEIPAMNNDSPPYRYRGVKLDVATLTDA